MYIASCICCCLLICCTLYHLYCMLIGYYCMVSIATAMATNGIVQEKENIEDTKGEGVCVCVCVKITMIGL